MEERRYAVVTGGNKGIGFEVCRQLALNGIEVILTARKESRGLEAVAKLKASGFQNIVFHQLDIKNTTSIAELVAFIRTQYKKLDILINNAGELGLVIKDGKKFKDGGGLMQVMDENVHLLTGIVDEPYEVAQECLKTNFYATKQITEAFVPLLNLSKSPRIVNVSSIFGELRWLHNENLKEELQDIESVTEYRIDEIIKSFLRDFKASKLWENGWPLTLSAYKVSKVALKAYTRILAKKYEKILVNCVYPGYVITNMTFNMGSSTTEEGAECVVMVALLPDDGPSGVYYRQMEIAPF